MKKWVFLDIEPESQEWDSLNTSTYPDEGNKIHKILLKSKNDRLSSSLKK